MKPCQLVRGIGEAILPIGSAVHDFVLHLFTMQSVKRFHTVYPSSTLLDIIYPCFDGVTFFIHVSMWPTLFIPCFDINVRRKHGSKFRRKQNFEKFLLSKMSHFSLSRRKIQVWNHVVVEKIKFRSTFLSRSSKFRSNLLSKSPNFYPYRRRSFDNTRHYVSMSLSTPMLTIHASTLFDILHPRTNVEISDS